MAEPRVSALEPLFGPSDIPDRHRARAKEKGARATIVRGRRPSPIAVAQNLRQEVFDWREAEYAGASNTSRTLLNHWFAEDHVSTTGQFSYYFCQREAIEALIYLY